MLQNVMTFLLLTLFVISNTGCRAQLTDGVASEDGSTLAAMAMPLVMPMLNAGLKIFSGTNDDAAVTTRDAGAINWASSLIPLFIPIVKAGLDMFNQAVNAGGSLGSRLRANSKNIGVPSNVEYPLRSMTMPFGGTEESIIPGNMNPAATTGGGGLGRLLGSTLGKLGADFLANLNSHGNVDQVKGSGGLGGLLSVAQLVANIANKPTDVDQPGNGNGDLGSLLNLPQLASMANSKTTENVNQAFKGSGDLGSLLNLAQMVERIADSNGKENVDQAANGSGGLVGLLSLAQMAASMADSNGTENVDQVANGSGALGNLLSLAQLTSVENSNKTKKNYQFHKSSALDGLFNFVKLGARIAHSNKLENVNQTSNKQGSINAMMNLGKSVDSNMAISNVSGNIKQQVDKESEGFEGPFSIAELGASMKNLNKIWDTDKASKGIADLGGLLNLAKLGDSIPNSKGSGDHPDNESERLKSILSIAKLGVSMLNTMNADNMDQAVNGSGSLDDITSLNGLMSIAKTAMSDSNASENINRPANNSERLKGFLEIGKLEASVKNDDETGHLNPASRAGAASLKLTELGNSVGSSDKTKNKDLVAIENDDSKGLLVLGANIMANSGLPNRMDKLSPSTRTLNKSVISNITEIPFLLRSSPSDMPCTATGELKGSGNKGGIRNLLTLFKLGASMANSRNNDPSDKTDMPLRNNAIEGPNRSKNFYIGKLMSIFNDMGDEDHGIASVPNGKVVKISREIRNKLGHIREEIKEKSESEPEEEELENRIGIRAKQFICKETKEGRKCMWSVNSGEDDNDK